MLSMLELLCYPCWKYFAIHVGNICRDMKNNPDNHNGANKGAANIEIMHMVKGQSKTNEHTRSPTIA